ncbi:zinc finger CCCH domain-containing protein 20-like [Pyrus ussuriensis x Pyrus communis]|uniref:Zinc finger CCCH domain-containing protein 20-like n=1 Tax=Pyrus ussuriensis x Pyrus communis TaxID=2448454 RepID=A0A5N5FS37_9ROSA|nr:zinc finger CCCH domain-containing protein 20-like [Pyrus ussuriensis x Pyrus communis]
MTLGELHRPNPTVHVPPSLPHDDSTADMYSPSPLSGNANGADFNSPYYLHEALTTLQCYLPSNETDLDSDSDISGRESDAPIDAYSCDHVRMFEFKVRRCARGPSHDWTECPYAHPGEKARRRDPRKYHYSGTGCPDFRKGHCKKGDACEFAHGVFEYWLHPSRYRTQPCKDGTSCKRRVCFFAHTPEQLRVLPQQSPRGGGNSLNEAESYDGSPLRQAMEAAAASCVKTMPFVSSRPEESPPVSPMSGPLGLGSINEMVASRRNLQFGKVKSFSSSRNVRTGGSSGFGSPVSPGFGSPCGSMPRQQEEALVMEMQMQMKGYLKDSNVGAVVGVVTPTDSNVGVGGVVTPNGTANHELAAKVLPSHRSPPPTTPRPSLSLPSSLQSIKFISSTIPNFHMHRYQLIFRILFQLSTSSPGSSCGSQPCFSKLHINLWTVRAVTLKNARLLPVAKDSWKMNEINTTEEAIPTRYYCYSCCHLVTVDVEVEIKCPFCHDGFIQACGGVNSLYLTMSTESELSESGSDGEVTSSEWILLLTSCGIETLASAFDQVSSPLNPRYALIGMLLAIVAVLVCICELLQNAIKERVVLRRRGMLWCFHYPPPNNMLFGTFPEIFGLVLAIVQCICSAVQYHFSRRHATSPIKLSPLPVVFAFSLVVSKLVQSRRCTADDTLQNGTIFTDGVSQLAKGSNFVPFKSCSVAGCLRSQPPCLVVSIVTGAVDRVPLLWVRYSGGGLELDLSLEAADKLRRDKLVAL